MSLLVRAIKHELNISAWYQTHYALCARFNYAGFVLKLNFPSKQKLVILLQKYMLLNISLLKSPFFQQEKENMYLFTFHQSFNCILVYEVLRCMIFTYYHAFYETS